LTIATIREFTITTQNGNVGVYLYVGLSMFLPAGLCTCG
jgi:hypothetical protein